MRIAALAGICVLAAAPLASAQTAGNPVAKALQGEWKTASHYAADSADLMDESNYAFKPVDSVRTFGQILAHVAGVNYIYCSAAKGEKSPYAEDYFEKNATTKAAIVKAVKDSNAYCDAVYDAATDASLAKQVPNPFGRGMTTSVSPLIGNIGHVNLHYGNLVTYFRLKNIVPPSSRRQ